MKNVKTEVITNKDKYLEYCKLKEDLPLFFHPFWLDAVCEEGSWDVAISEDKARNIQGVFPYFMKRKYGLKSITMPLLTPFMGIIYEYPKGLLKEHARLSFEKKVSQDLIEQLPGHFYFNVLFDHRFQNWLPIKWKNFRQTTQYTYVLNNLTDVDLETNFKGSVRTDIKKASEICVVEACDDVDLFYDINKKSFERQGLSILYSNAYFQQIDEALKSRKLRDIFIARDKEGNVHAGVYIAYDNECAYCLAIGSDPNFRKHASVTLLLNHAIKTAGQKVRKFDFEGGMMANIESVFRAFGAQQQSYFRIYRTKNALTDAIFTLLGKI